MANCREASEKHWLANDAPTLDQINAGSFQRIADAAERMAGNFLALQRDRDYYKRRLDEELAASRRLARQIVGLRGALTRLKRRREAP